jgi:son of sevenless-like protein
MCYDLLNFNAAMEILSSLSLTCVDRLKDTWKGIPKKEKEILESLKYIFQPKKNYQNYRSVLESVQTTCLPYIGSVLHMHTSSISKHTTHQIKNVCFALELQQT